MSITEVIREQVRLRAGYACEFCGISETDTGGLLTVDHFRPQSKGGEDILENLIYCCPRCNQYKSDYWPSCMDDTQLWNPRKELFSQHFLELENGMLHPLTETGVFTLKRLRLNRPPLATHQQCRRRRAEETRLLARYRDLAQLLEQLLEQQTSLLEEQRGLLKEQLRLLRIFEQHE